MLKIKPLSGPERSLSDSERSAIALDLGLPRVIGDKLVLPSGDAFGPPVSKDGASVGTAVALNFTGEGVAVSRTGETVTVEVLATSGPGGGTVDVAANGALVKDGAVVAPAYLGVRTPAQITAINAAIAASTATYPPGSLLITDQGQPLILKGTGTAASFSPDTSTAPEVIVQPIRTGASNAVQADSGAIVPFSSAATYTVGAGLADFSVVLERADAALLRVPSGAGVTFWHNNAIVTELAVTGIGHYIVVRPRAGAENHYVLSRYAGV